MQGIYQKQPPPTQQKQKQKQKEQVVDMDVMKKLIEELERGQNSVHIVRSLILQHHPRIIMKVEDDTCENKNEDDNDDDKHDYIKALNHHSMVALDTYHNTMSMLRSCSNSSSIYVGSVKKRKLLDRSSAHHHEVISPINVNSTCNNSVVDDRRECDKKRKVSAKSREEEVTQLTYDGFSWRKYGQKIILNYHYPRHYYRCTHKYEQNCQATKQIQQLSNNPTKYKLMYHGSHTCNKNKMNNDILETSPYIIDSPEEHPNSIVLNFDGSNQVNPSLFPTSWDHLSSVDDMARATNDIVALNPISENNSCVTSPINIEEEYYCYDNIMADFSQLSDLWTI